MFHESVDMSSPPKAMMGGTSLQHKTSAFQLQTPDTHAMNVLAATITSGPLCGTQFPPTIPPSAGSLPPAGTTSSMPGAPSRLSAESNGSLRVPSSAGSQAVAAHRKSSPARFSPPPISSPAPTPAGRHQVDSSAPSSPQQARPIPPHRHTLEVPRSATSSSTTWPRNSKEISSPVAANVGEEATPNGRLSPLTGRTRRASLTLARRATRSVHSDLLADEVPPDEDAARWAEAIRQRRASKKKRKEEEDDDRVLVGSRVDENHVNWVTAYNMLTGIRFTVSRINAKIDRELNDADFTAKYKFSFDITGNELTPSAKYDFKFKDYAPWVFRHLRSIFKLDPADYLMSLTSKYILSELGSPGKSGSFFYFSRDYKYIIKTIHHAEHKALRKVLKDYYLHVRDNPNTLLSQFYGLHRVKIPYGRKIHFVVMNNLFPPHRDIHKTFDLKGSTIGRNLKEENLEEHPRAVLKDLNWLRRNMHLELGPDKKSTFLDQIERDVKLLQKLKIMDYSLLVGIHDLERGNDDNLRDKTLQVFQPGGDDAEEPPQHPSLTRTISKAENARKARELRQLVKNQRPVPLGRTTSKMPDEMPNDLLHERRNFVFYSDDGGIRATHEDNAPGEAIYYLGIIDCLTKYNVVKRTEHFLKSMVNVESEISAIPPERYGDRFVKFLTSITKSREKGGEEMEGSIPDRSRNTLDLQDGLTLPVVEETLDGASDEVAEPYEKQEDYEADIKPQRTNVQDIEKQAVNGPV